jgi:hypothetical protein
MNRRDLFKSLLGAAVAVHELDVEKLLWIPGKKTIFIPPPEQYNQEASWEEWPEYRDIVDSYDEYLRALVEWRDRERAHESVARYALLHQFRNRRSMRLHRLD